MNFYSCLKQEKVLQEHLRKINVKRASEGDSNLIGVVLRKSYSRVKIAVNFSFALFLLSFALVCIIQSINYDWNGCLETSVGVEENTRNLHLIQWKLSIKKSMLRGRLSHSNAKLSFSVTEDEFSVVEIHRESFLRAFDSIFCRVNGKTNYLWNYPYRESIKGTCQSSFDESILTLALDITVEHEDNDARKAFYCIPKLGT
jgi:hypothetical protein